MYDGALFLGKVLCLPVMARHIKKLITDEQIRVSIYGSLALNGIHNFESFANFTKTYVLHTRFVPFLIQTIARAKLYCLS